jgi:hypothetical protein
VTPSIRGKPGVKYNTCQQPRSGLNIQQSIEIKPFNGSYLSVLLSDSFTGGYSNIVLSGHNCIVALNVSTPGIVILVLPFVNFCSEQRSDFIPFPPEKSFDLKRLFRVCSTIYSYKVLSHRKLN